jgi:hypothetical protein
MVNIRATLAAAVAQRVLDADLAARLAGLAKALFYKERTYSAILCAAAERGLPEPPVKALSSWLPHRLVNAKSADALALLSAASRHVAGGVSPLQVRYSLSVTAAWRRAALSRQLI